MALFDDVLGYASQGADIYSKFTAPKNTQEVARTVQAANNVPVVAPSTPGFFEKNKTMIFIAGGGVLLLLIVLILFRK